MNYYQPRELKDRDGNATGLYHYTVMNDDRVWAVGYCRDGCAGHATPDEARAHYRQYLVETARLNETMTGQQQPCEVCGAWTQGLTLVGPGMMEAHTLCDEHRTKEHLLSLVQIGDAVSSY